MPMNNAVSIPVPKSRQRTESISVLGMRDLVDDVGTSMRLLRPKIPVLEMIKSTHEWGERVTGRTKDRT